MDENEAPRRKLTAEESNRLLLERIEMTKQVKSPLARGAQWADTSEKERGEAGAALMRFAYDAIRFRTPPCQKPPLRFPRVPQGHP
ncbi:MAG: hypothetical protein HYX53_14430 [Chloroflexi bacterium]|nr:hypothetical protein [Chloroflexota bacterium]